MYFESNEFMQAGRRLLERIKEDPSIMRNILQRIDTYADELLQASSRMREQTVAALTDRGLFEWYKKTYAIHEPLWVLGQAVNYLEHENSLLMPLLKNSLLEDGVPQSRVQSVLMVLTTSPRYSFMQAEEQDLLKIATGDSSASVEDHWKKYQWMGYGWAGPPYDISYYQDRLELLEGDRERSRSFVKSEDAYALDVEAKKREVKKEYSFSEKTLAFAGFVEDIIRLKAYRVDVSHQYYWSMEPYFREIGRRKHLSVRQLQAVLPPEMEDLLLHGRFDENQLNARWTQDVIFIKEGTMQEEPGPIAREYLAALEDITGFDTLPDELSGDCGSPGSARGEVCIIVDPKDIGTMEQDAILVSHMTDPRFVPAMKKARAIVAEIGGITCHAAIVARELGIPCVIGVKKATKFLKDGDRIEVDADNGVVKKII
ncbi:MAG: hypothetical protein COU35_02505 [Candidatus Magasanikbacteria bacterium CG10_big_fil_rev_8_21_14_0_10_47_10]|uniref:PEP-utilising enzyme mobile domain-containing protein n=1 Tax=Candidatus Magasanikbacteria bacterium CG10_big_fil_rev_8_21_14_0_10_47_10 TaxID=1974652 RepID=A0A2H0TQL1_9BACT|nr:MAG: hypothetical protein COU35_02505 [Candidatus Magasanikbacteria bacterium CG10_big_fil_rev_8_21_14_0_10_47_10]